MWTKMYHVTHLQGVTVDVNRLTDGSPGTIWWDWIIELNHRNGLVPAFPPKSREFPRSPGIPREFPGNSPGIGNEA